MIIKKEALTDLSETVGSELFTTTSVGTTRESIRSLFGSVHQDESTFTPTLSRRVSMIIVSDDDDTPSAALRFCDAFVRFESPV